MSHPWKAQPYYMHQQPRTSGTVPAPMGQVLVLDPLGFGGYTRGSFAPKSPWNVPKYVADEPTGVDGFRGFGADQPGCIPAAQAAEALGKALDVALTRVYLPALPAPAEAWSNKSLGSLGIGANIKPLLAAGITELAQLMATAKDKLRMWLRSLILGATRVTVGSSACDVIGAAYKVLKPGSIAGGDSTDVWAYLADELLKAGFGDALSSGICLEGVAAGIPWSCVPDVARDADLRKQGVVAGSAVSVCTKDDTTVRITSYDVARINKIGWDAWLKEALFAAGVGMASVGDVRKATQQLYAAMQKTAEQRGGLTFKSVIPLNLSLLPKPAAMPTTPAAPVKKTPPYLLIGAAALAAMLLLKK